MRILTGKKWLSGFLDYYRNKTEYRIQVLAWKNLEKLENVYHTRAKSLRLLWNYLPVVGPEGLWTKTWSRIREERRNEKYISCGIGKIIEAADDNEFALGEMVSFIAPWHPALAERIVLPKELIFKLENTETPQKGGQNIIYLPLTKQEKNGWWKEIKAWSVYAGVEINEKTRKALEKNLRQELKNTEWPKAEEIKAADPGPISQTKGQITRTDPQRKKGVLFGFGNYAKINIIPYTKKFVDITTVHEIDPTQIFMGGRVQKWDSAPFPAKDEKYDVYFVASYNHTHIPITLHGLKQGAYVLMEKPVAMDYEELSELEKTLKTVGRKLFVGFHKRYGAFNKMALKDLGVTYGEPISYHSIVYELEQPEYFWYNWPVSRSTFLANGCHQIDHFLHLNNWSKPVNAEIKLLRDHTVLVWLELENGATFTTAFSEKGSLRVGPRDRVELKVRGRDVRITDAIHYLSEDNRRIIRKMRIFKTNSYKDMYQTIGRKIAANEPGDSLESLMISTKLMLDLEEKLQKMKGWGNRYDKAKERFWRYFAK